MLAKQTDTILVSFEDAKNRIKHAKNVVFTGTPVKIKKKEYTINEKLDIIKKAGLKETKPIILIFGGSQGAQKINDAILGILKNKSNKDYQIMWATGPKQYDIIKERLENNHININNIDNTEISNLGKPSILIPLPNVSNDHQLYNAKVLEKVNAAKIILNDKLNDKNLDFEIKNIVLNKNVLNEMGQNALKVATTDVEDKIYSEIKKLKKY